jgi:diketogulonate reductase-like aldo/keto reductase
MSSASTCQIPKIGFGTYQLRDDEAYNSVITALNSGYIHIDTAKLYKNEANVGQAIKDSGKSRDVLFITTKVLNKDVIKGKQRILSAFEKSLSDLQTDYVDLLLLHSAILDKLDDSWSALEYLYTHGKCKMIGVSNFDISDLTFLDKLNKTIKPMVDQIELSPFYTREKLVSHCRTNGIIVEAHTSLTRGQKLSHPVIVDMAKKYNISPAQIMLKWALQNNYIILPRSSVVSEIQENINIPDQEIGSEDMQILNGLNENFLLTKKHDS